MGGLPKARKGSPHYIALHHTTLHCTTLHYATLHHTTLHYTTLHNTTLDTTPHHATKHYTPINIALHNTRSNTTHTASIDQQWHEFLYGCMHELEVRAQWILKLCQRMCQTCIDQGITQSGSCPSALICLASFAALPPASEASALAVAVGLPSAMAAVLALCHALGARA